MTTGPDSPRRPSDRKDVFVRPFMVTRGRTTPLVDNLQIETLVQATPAALTAPLQFEQQVVAQLCQGPHSIAEISAALGVPLGVAKVLVGDLVTAGYVSAHQPDQLTVATVTRIRDLVREL